MTAEKRLNGATKKLGRRLKGSMGENVWGDRVHLGIVYFTVAKHGNQD
jgi:hypothetical protein